MYYHSTILKHVEYGKVRGNPDPDPDFAYFYKWLGNYCGFFPQVWLSRSHSQITGYRNTKDQVLFCFDTIKGFPVSFDPWCCIINALWQCQGNKLDPVKDKKKIGTILNFHMHPSGLPEEFDEWLRKNVFFKDDQVVVPSLNLKSAKEVHCRNEKQKKKLRKMGFIEDRIKIRKMPHGDIW